jgi:hypothetical protein
VLLLKGAKYNRHIVLLGESNFLWLSFLCHTNVMIQKIYPSTWNSLLGNTGVVMNFIMLITLVITILQNNNLLWSIT